jgi:hypothetical protein
MSARWGLPRAQGVPPGEGVGRPSWTLKGVPPDKGIERTTETLTHPRGEDDRSKALIQTRHRRKRRRPHEGKKAFIRAAKRPSKPAQPAKVLGRIKSRAAEMVVKQLRRPPT